MPNQFDDGRLRSILTKEFLIEEYCIKKLFAKEIGKNVGCSGSTIGTYLKKYGIPVEARYEDRELSGKLNPARKMLTKEYLEQEYINNKRSISNIARELNCSIPLVSEFLRTYGIPQENRRNGSSGDLNGQSFYGFRMEGDYLTVLLPGHHLANESGYVRLHDALAEYYFNHRLLPGEVVHHKNENKQDNRKENLEIMDKPEHDRYHTQKRWDNGTFR